VPRRAGAAHLPLQTRRVTALVGRGHLYGGRIRGEHGIRMKQRDQPLEVAVPRRREKRLHGFHAAADVVQHERHPLGGRQRVEHHVKRRVGPA
jgi:hypothetical protein